MMKTLRVISLSLVAWIFTGYPVSAGDPFVEAMKKSIHEIYHASGIQQYQIAVNKFERIAAAESTRWEPFYYAGFGYIMMSNLESDLKKKDQYLDQAQASIDKAKQFAENECELIALQGFVEMMRITVDPATRGAEFAPRAMASFNKATALDPENPRVLALLAQMEYGTAQFFGSSTGEACLKAKTALLKFDHANESNPLAPQWGKTMAKSLVDRCQ